MYLEEKRNYLHIGLHPWTDGKRTLYGCGWGDGTARLSLRANSMEPELELPEEELIERFTPVTQGVQYVVGYVLDQTWGYWTDPEEKWTTTHPQATIYATLAEAETVFKEEHADFIEAVLDVEEFRKRPDTW